VTEELNSELAERIRRELSHLSLNEARELGRVIERLAERLQPEWIFVFGSQARGDARPDSDIDLLIVVPHSDLPPHRRDQEAYGAVGRHLVPLDILVMTRAEFEQRRAASASLPATVLHEGRVLYAAQVPR
jgi:predicted nucleotidyltransferase